MRDLIQKLREVFTTYSDIRDDLMELASSYNQEILQIYLAKNDKLVYQGRWDASRGKKWNAKDYNTLQLSNHANRYGTGSDVEVEEILSAVKSSDADEVLFVHNHPGTVARIDLPPSGGDIRTAKFIGELADSVDINARFFIVHSSKGYERGIMIEFDRNGKIIWTNQPQYQNYWDRL